MFKLGSLHSVHCCYCHKQFLAEPGKQEDQEDWCLNAACEICNETQEILTGAKSPTFVPIMWLYKGKP